MKKITKLQIFRLYETHKKPMIQLALRRLHDINAAEDCVQDAFEKLINYIEVKGNPMDDVHLEALIVLFCSQLSIDAYRKQKVRAGYSFDENRDAPIDYNFEKMVVNRQYAKELYLLLKEELKTEDLDIATLKYGYGFTSKEIGEKYGLDDNGINQRIFKFKKKAKTVLEVNHGKT